MAFLNKDEVFYLEPVFSPITATGNASISGSIEEGVLLLVDNHGYIHDQAIVFDDSLERDLNSSGSDPSYTFSFTKLSAQRSFRLYLITNGVTWSVFGDNDGDGAPNSNVFALSEGSNINLGLINWTEADDGKLLTQFNIFGQAGVVAKPINQRIPIMMEQPPINGLSLEKLVRRGMGALYNGWVGGADTYLGRVVSSTRHGTSNDADTARFFQAFSTLAALAFEYSSDGDAETLDRIGDILDLLGIPDDSRRGSPRWMELPEEVDLRTETTEQMAKFIDTAMRNSLSRAARLLSQVSSTFNVTWVRPDNGNQVENDFADARFFLGLIKLELAYIALWDAYDLDFDIDSLVETESDDIPGNDETVESFLAKNPKFLSLNDRSKLGQSRDLLLFGAINNLELTIKSIEEETDSQEDDLIRLTSLDTQEITRTRRYLTRIKRSIESGSTLIEAHDSGDRRKDIILDLRRFFAIGVDFRNDGLLPPVIGNDLDKSQPCLPDPTFNGVVVSPDLDTVVFDDYECQ
jgi:hypothetical protein